MPIEERLPPASAAPAERVEKVLGVLLPRLGQQAAQRDGCCLLRPRGHRLRRVPLGLDASGLRRRGGLPRRLRRLRLLLLLSRLALLLHLPLLGLGRLRPLHVEGVAEPGQLGRRRLGRGGVAARLRRVPQPVPARARQRAQLRRRTSIGQRAGCIEREREPRAAPPHERLVQPAHSPRHQPLLLLLGRAPGQTKDGLARIGVGRREIGSERALDSLSVACDGLLVLLIIERRVAIGLGHEHSSSSCYIEIAIVVLQVVEERGSGFHCGSGVFDLQVEARGAPQRPASDDDASTPTHAARRLHRQLCDSAERLRGVTEGPSAVAPARAHGTDAERRREAESGGQQAQRQAGSAHRKLMNCN